MSEELLPFYNRELAYLRRLGAEFSAAHPKIAGRLRLTPDAIEDPHVSRLVESVAFLNARIRKKLDDGLPELSEALFSVLYPHFLAPVPSMAIAEFECDPELTGSYAVPAGTLLETERIDGQAVRYRTGTPATLWPIRVKKAQLEGLHPKLAVKPRAAGCAAVLRIELETCTEGLRFSSLRPGSLRFFLKGQEQHAFLLYELLFNDLVELALASSARDGAPARLAPRAVHAVGFERNEGLLPCPERSFPGYRLLSEYFAFPARFLFFDLELPEAKLREAGRTLELSFFLRRSDPDLEQLVGAETFALGCAPVVNLFQKRAEPVRLTATDSEIRVVAVARRPRSIEVYSIDRVSASSPAGERVEYRPFYGLDHGGDGGRLWWTAARRAASSADRQDQGTEVHLSLVDLARGPGGPVGWVLEVETTCLNRDLPARLPVSPRLSLAEGGGPIRAIRCLTHPTRTLRRAQDGALLWQLVSQLSLNHLSLTRGGAARESLQEILRLYDVEGSRANAELVEGILAVSSRETTRRVLSGGEPGFARGMEVTLHADEGRFAGSGLFLFGCVMERFLALYGSLNSFVQLVLTTNQRPGELHRWPPRAGDHPLL